MTMQTTSGINLVEAPAVLVEIARCESGQRQFNDNGTVLRGRVNSKDVGYFQLNEKYWLSKSKELGYDIYSEEGNIAMGLWIYKRYGTQPWDSSRSCWAAEDT